MWDLVDDVDLGPTAGGGVADVLPQIADLVDAPVAGPVDLEHVETGAARDLLTGIALVARLRDGTVGRPLAVQGLGQDASRRGLADSSRTGEEKGVREAPGLDRVGERSGDVLLPDDVFEALGAPAPGENLIGQPHPPFLRLLPRRRRPGDLPHPGRST